MLSQQAQYTARSSSATDAFPLEPLPAFDYPARKYTHGSSTNGAAISSSSNSSSSAGFSAVRSPEVIERYSSSTAATTGTATTGTAADSRSIAAAVAAATAPLHSQNATLREQLAKSDERNKLLQLKLRAASLAKPPSYALQLQQQQQQLQQQQEQLQQRIDVQAAHRALQQWLSSTQATADAAAQQSAELKSEYEGMLLGGCTLQELTDRLEQVVTNSAKLR
jgi:hypothetical protein